MFRAHVLIIRRSKFALHILWYHHTHRYHHTYRCDDTYECDDTRGCVMQFWPPDDEHMCSKHVEAWNKLIVKQKCCASSWLITDINILRCSTVSETSKDTVHVTYGLSVHHQAFKTVHIATGICQTDTAVSLLVSRQQYLLDALIHLVGFNMKICFMQLCAPWW